jgi:hypothetical protein
MLLFHRRNRMLKKGSSLVQKELVSPLRLSMGLPSKS